LQPNVADQSEAAMPSAEIEEQERASSAALSKVNLHFFQEIIKRPFGYDIVNVDEALRFTQAFQRTLDTFEADALRYQQAGLPRMADELAQYRTTAQKYETTFRNTLSALLNQPSTQSSTGANSGPRRCPPNMLMEKMNAYRGYIAAGWPPAAAQAQVDWWFGV
jgi:hypothetical protein